MDELEIALRKDMLYSLLKLKQGLAKNCADDILEVLINLEDGTCDYIGLNPTLEEIAEVESFFFFDDFSMYDEDKEDEADPTRKTSFRQSALKAVENIRENFYKLKSATLTHRALKSNNTYIIKTTLEQLTMQVNLDDKTMIPILEKIAVKDVYKAYFYKADIKTDCRLGALAFRVIEIIEANTTRGNDHVSKIKFFIKTCSVCSSLPDDITVNTGREERLPDALRQLTWMSGNNNDGYYRCPGCHTYFNRIDMPQVYGSGNCDEERLVRLSLEESYLLNRS